MTNAPVENIERQIAETVRLFVVDDGETHWVAARSVDEAVRFVAAIADSTLEQYRSDYEPKTRWADMTKPLRVFTDLPVPEDYPVGCEVVVEIPPRLFSKLKPGLIGSTVY